MHDDTLSAPIASEAMDELRSYRFSFEEDERLRSDFIRGLTLRQLGTSTANEGMQLAGPGRIPRTLVRFWHDPSNLPEDVGVCLASWDRLGSEGFDLRMFDDASGAAYIARTYGPPEVRAFARCRHPAMRSDYLRMCFILAEGGLYVDADDVLLGDGWRAIFRDAKLKLQPLCYDIPSSGMLGATEIQRTDLPTDGRIFYVNNDPIAAPAGHPVIRRALARATERLLGEESLPEIQSTTGPGNLTAALCAHARELMHFARPFDFDFLLDWEAIAETRWDLSYRGDARNWRLMDASVGEIGSGSAA